jgi:ATP/maltotriose-dependent transcriptional regulator MalT
VSAEFGGLIFMALGIAALLWLALRSERSTRRSETRKERSDVQAERITILENTVNTLLLKLNDAQREIDTLRQQLNTANQRIAELEVNLRMPGGTTEPFKRPAKPLLLVQCNQLFGEDDALAIRRIGIPFHRLKDATSADFDRYLQAGRQDHTTPWWCQISAHMDAKGIQFLDGVKDKTWLSQRIRGIRILVLAGCANEEVGAQLVGLARHVVVVYEAIESQYAQDFSFAFWKEISEGAEPADAFARALDECPQVSEFVQMRTARA